MSANVASFANVIARFIISHSQIAITAYSLMTLNSVHRIAWWRNAIPASTIISYWSACRSRVKTSLKARSTSKTTRFVRPWTSDTSTWRWLSMRIAAKIVALTRRGLRWMLFVTMRLYTGTVFDLNERPAYLSSFKSRLKTHLFRHAFRQ